MTTYKPGDIVTLRSGGPPMTVVAVARDGKEEADGSPGRPMLLQCRWFSGTELRAAPFPAESLALCPETPLDHSHIPVVLETPKLPS